VQSLGIVVDEVVRNNFLEIGDGVCRMVQTLFLYGSVESLNMGIVVTLSYSTVTMSDMSLLHGMRKPL